MEIPQVHTGNVSGSLERREGSTIARPETIQHTETKPKEKNEVIFLDKLKYWVNITTNGGASVFNLFTFMEGNWGLLGLNQERLEFWSGFLSKVATGTQGILGMVDTGIKRNIIPLIGFFLEIPVSMFSSDNNLWLYRGLTQGWIQFQGVFKRTVLKIKDNNNEEKEKFVGDNWKERGGIWTGIKTNLHIIPKTVREIFNDLKITVTRGKGFPHALLTCSFFQMVGALTALCGFEKTGAGIRDFWGATVDFAFMLDKKPNDATNNSQLPDENKNKSASYFPAGIVWVGAAIIDFVKRFTDRVPNMTQLSLFFDRLASVFFVIANIDDSPENIATQSETEEYFGLKKAA